MHRRLKIILLPLTVLFALVFLIIFPLSLTASQTFKHQSNREMSELIGAIIESNPEIDASVLIRQLKHPNFDAEATGRALLESYGYFETDTVSQNAAKLAGQMLDLCLASIVIFALFALVYFWYQDWQRERQLTRLVDYLQDLKERIYDLKLEENTEGELSILTNEIYKITVLLKEAAENNRLRSQNLETALADISHQLRTPLTSLQIMVDNIYDDPDMPQETRQDFLRAISHQIESMSDLVMTLLNLAKFDNGSIKLRQLPVQVGELLSEVRQSLAALADLGDVQIDIDGDLSAQAKLDRRWQKEALANIIKNCIEHSTPGSKINVLAQDCPLFLRIKIKDVGEGIAKEDLRHIFERFYKTKNSSKNSVGIGLAFAKAVVEADNGQISVKSEKGVGTEFSITYLK